MEERQEKRGEETCVRLYRGGEEVGRQARQDKQRGTEEESEGRGWVGEG